MTDLDILRRDWLAHLAAERRLSPKTLEAYARDLGQFTAFLSDHLGAAPSVTDVAALKPVDLRAFLGRRRRDGVGSPTRRALQAGRRSPGRTARAPAWLEHR